MKYSRFILLLVIAIAALSIASCYMPINGHVVDAETSQPIEGAVVLVEWTKTIGYGLTHTESYKVAEVLSDKDGYFELPGCYYPFVNEPDVAIYKKGYVTWSSRSIFPSRRKKNDFQWKSKGSYRLDKFRKEYSYTDHESFTSRAINDTTGWENKRLFRRKYDEGERELVVKEQNEKDLQRLRGPRQ